LFPEGDKVRKIQAIEDLKNQIKIEGQLVGLYEEQERAIDNQAMKRLMQMFRLDSQRHINILQAAIEIIEGKELFIEDREPLAATLGKHLELEAEALKNANKMLGQGWVDENKGLKNLLGLWRDDEKRHHSALKRIIDRPYFRLGRNEYVAVFHGEEFLEERYRRSKAFKEKQKQ
jgi:rubrerythrin